MVVDDIAGSTSSTSSTIRVPCPGRAHDTGDECVICDEDNDGTISVVVTEVELGALGCAARGRPIDALLAPRLHVIGLLHQVAGCWLPTAEGYALIGGISRAN